MDINLGEFDKIGQQKKLLEFSQLNLDLVGSIFKSDKIQGFFGTADIINVRQHPIILVQGNQIKSFHNQTSRGIIVKSNKNRKLSKIVADGQNNNEEEEIIDQNEPHKNEQMSDSLFNDESEEKELEVKVSKIRKKKEIDLKKYLRNKLRQLKSQEKK